MPVSWTKLRAASLNHTSLEHQKPRRCKQARELMITVRSTTWHSQISGCPLTTFHTAVRDSAAIISLSVSQNLFCSRPKMCSVIKTPLRGPSFWLEFRFGYFCILKGNSTDCMYQSFWSWVATLHPYTSYVRPPVEGPLRVMSLESESY